MKHKMMIAAIPMICHRSDLMDILMHTGVMVVGAIDKLMSHREYHSDQQRKRPKVFSSHDGIIQVKYRSDS